ncbi:MAG: LLM class F420-dependent oxidoreductase [Polyangiaceae bacterium]|nr:LLM class F420-dependent oxidoreductase [Polyangiaceae bacterium]
MIAIARKAEEVGVESVWTFEHVVVPESYESRYPYSPKGKMPISSDVAIVDPLVALACIAGATTKLKLGTGVNILPQANPLFIAKQVASLDFVSHGRFIFGVGIGWLEEEYEALGVPFARRGARFDEYIAAIKKIWTGDVVEHAGEFVRWSGFRSYPLPVQRPHPPIVIGGASDRALARVVEHGDGYIAPNDSIEQLESLLARLRRISAERGRDPSTIEVTAKWIASKDPGGLEKIRDLGVARVIVPIRGLPDREVNAGLDKLGELIAKL